MDNSLDKPMKISLAEIHDRFVKGWKLKADDLEQQVKELKEERRESIINNVVVNNLILALTKHDRNTIFNMFVKWKESERPTGQNCNCHSNAIGKFDPLEYQEGQPGVEPFNPETFRHTCTDSEDYGYVWDMNSMSWTTPHIQDCADHQSGGDCMHMEGEGDWDFFDQLEDDTGFEYEIVYDEMEEQKLSDNITPLNDSSIIVVKTNYCVDMKLLSRTGDHFCELPCYPTKESSIHEHHITATPVDFFNYIADTYPMTWIRWNLANDNPLNDVESNLSCLKHEKECMCMESIYDINNLNKHVTEDSSK